MLSLDLFDSRYEKRLHEGALDDTITRTQAHLMEPLSRRAADIRTQIRTGKLSGAELDKLEKEYEDLVQKRLDIMLDRQPKNEQQVPSKQDPFAYVKPEPKGIGDIQDPKQKMAQLQQRAKKGPLANVAAGIKAFVKGEPEPMGEQTQPRTHAQNVYFEILKAWEDERDYIVIPFPNAPNPVTMIRGQLWNAIVDLGSIKDPKRRAKYVEERFNDFESFMSWLGNLKRYKVPAKKKGKTQSLPLQIPQQPTGQAQPTAPGSPLMDPEFTGIKPPGNLQEKKKSSDLEPKDVGLSRELQKARARFPAAASDLEAGILDQMDQQQQAQQALAQQQADLNRQDQQIAGLTQANQQHDGVMRAQGQEIDRLTQRLQQVMAQPTAATAPAPVGPQAEPTAAPAAAPAPDMVYVPDMPADTATQDREIARLNKQIQQLELMMTLKTPAERSDLEDRIRDLEKARAEQEEKKRATAQKSAATRQRKKQATTIDMEPTQAQLDYLDPSAIIGRVRPKPEQGAEVAAAQDVIRKAQKSSRQQAVTNEGQPQELINRYLAIDAETDVDAVRQAIQAISKDPALSVTSKSRLLGQIGMIIQRHRLPIGRSYYQFMQQYMEAVELDRNRVVGYPQDPATVKHRLDTAKAILGNPRSDADSRREAAAIVAKLEKKVVAEGLLYSGDTWQDVLYRINVLNDIFGDQRDLAASFEPASQPEWGPFRDRILRSRTVLDTYAKVKQLANMNVPLTNVEIEMLADVAWDGGGGPVEPAGHWGERDYDWLQDLYAQQFAVVSHLLDQRAQGHGQNKTKSGQTVHEQGMAETVTNVKAGMAKIYRRLAPKIERHRDSFLAGQLYDELENYAELHGAEGEFKRMMATARNSAHMEYDTNPGDFQNWFWFLPFEDDTMTENTDDVKKRMSKLEALALAANRAGDDAKCKMYQQKIQSLKQKLWQSMAEGKIKDIDIMRQDLDSMSDLQFLRAHGMKKDQFKYKYRDLLKPAPQQDVPVQESLRPGEYHIHTVYFKDGTKKRIRVTSDEFDVVNYYNKRGQAVDRVDYDYQIHSDMTEQDQQPGTDIPRKSIIQGYTVYWNPDTQMVSVTRGGDSEQAAIEQARVRNINKDRFLAAAYRMIDRIEELAEHISREPRTARERDDMIDKIRRMMTQDRNPANRQIMQADIEMLQTKYRDLKEDSDSTEAVEMAIMRRMLVAHTDLIMRHGLDGVVAAIEEVAYDVGDVDEIGTSDVSAYVRRVQRILEPDNEV